MRTYAPLVCGDRLPDARLERRLKTMVEQFSDQPNCPIPQATETRNDMDAAYNFFANERVNPAAIVASCHSQLLAQLTGLTRILAVQDSTDCNFSSLLGTEGLGYTNGAKIRGLLLHSTLALSPQGLSLGLLSQQIWTRDPASQGTAQKR